MNGYDLTVGLVLVGAVVVLVVPAVLFVVARLAGWISFRIR